MPATRQFSGDEERSQIKRGLKEAFRKFESESFDDVKPTGYNSRSNVDDSFEVAVYADVLAQDEDPLNDLESAYRYIMNIAKHVEAVNDGEVKPVVYTLPIGVFAIFGATIPADVTVG